MVVTLPNDFLVLDCSLPPSQGTWGERGNACKPGILDLGEINTGGSIILCGGYHSVHGRVVSTTIPGFSLLHVSSNPFLPLGTTQSVCTLCQMSPGEQLPCVRSTDAKPGTMPGTF